MEIKFHNALEPINKKIPDLLYGSVFRIGICWYILLKIESENEAYVFDLDSKAFLHMRCDTKIDEIARHVEIHIWR